MQTKDMTEPLTGTRPIDWQQTCESLVDDFKAIARDAPAGGAFTNRLEAFGEQLTWMLAHAPVADGAKYTGTTTGVPTY